MMFIKPSKLQTEGWLYRNPETRARRQLRAVLMYFAVVARLWS